MRKSPLRVRVRLGFGVIAWVQPVGEYRAVGLGTTQPALVADLRKLESDEAFQDLLTWHSARMTRLADQSCYLLRPSGLPRFFRELRHFFNLHFPGV